MSVLLLERHLVDPARRRSYESLLASLLESMRPAGGFLWADAAASIEEPELVSVASEWRTDADLDAFRDGAAYATFCASADVCLRESPSVRRFVAL